MNQDAEQTRDLLIKRTFRVPVAVVWRMRAEQELRTQWRRGFPASAFCRTFVHVAFGRPTYFQRQKEICEPVACFVRLTAADGSVSASGGTGDPERKPKPYAPSSLSRATAAPFSISTRRRSGRLSHETGTWGVELFLQPPDWPVRATRDQQCGQWRQP